MAARCRYDFGDCGAEGRGPLAVVSWDALPPNGGSYFQIYIYNMNIRVYTFLQMYTYVARYMHIVCVYIYVCITRCILVYTHTHI